MRSLLKHLSQLLIEPPAGYEPATRLKSRLLSIFLLVMIFIFSIVDGVSWLTSPNYQVPWYGYVFLITAYILNRLPYYRISATLVVFMFPVVIFVALSTARAGESVWSLGFLVVGLIAASILLPWQGVLILALCDIGGTLLLPRLAPDWFPDETSIIIPLAVISIGAILSLISMWHRDQVEADRQALLRQSEERYRMLFDEAPDGILIVSAETRILMANAAIYQMTGYSPEEVIGQDPTKFIAPEDRLQRPPRPVKEIQVPGTVKRERVLICKDQSRVTVVISSTYMPDGHLQYTLQDITERRKMDDALRASEEKFARSFQSSPDAITISSIETGKFIDLNNGFCEMSGYSREEALGRSADELHIWDNVEHRKQMVELLKRDGHVRNFETTLRRRSGEALNCLLSVEVIEIAGEKCMVVITRDITERKRMEEDLRLSEERYRLVSSVISDYTFFTRVETDGTMRLSWTAGAFEKITGYLPEEINTSGGWASTVHPEDTDQDAHDMEMLRNNQRVVTEIRTIRKDGKVRWVRVYAHPIWDAKKNRLAGIYGAVQDIHEQKRIEQERENLIDELEAKNAELEQFTYMVSHDLKAPIITIKGFLGFLSEDARTGNIERLEADIRRISAAADRMHTLLNDLLELSRIGRLMNDPEEVDTRELVIEAEQILHGRLQKRNVQIVIKEALPYVYGDRQRLIEVFQNLIDNASKFMGDQANPCIEIGTREDLQNGLITLYIRDNGIGIAPQFHERIFGLFNRLDPTVDGTGVGLALVKRIIEFHSGKIWVESEVGQGATFLFTIPRVVTIEDEIPNLD
jgi:PAS domain S-box-containing protein